MSNCKCPCTVCLLAVVSWVSWAPTSLESSCNWNFSLNYFGPSSFSIIDGNSPLRFNAWVSMVREWLAIPKYTYHQWIWKWGEWMGNCSRVSFLTLIKIIFDWLYFIQQCVLQYFTVLFAKPRVDQEAEEWRTRPTAWDVAIFILVFASWMMGHLLLQTTLLTCLGHSNLKSWPLPNFDWGDYWINYNLRRWHTN